MADIRLTTGFSTVMGPDQEAITRLLTETIEQIAQDDKSFTRAKIVFTESDERCGLTAELDGVKKEGVPLQIDLETLEDAQTQAGARALNASKPDGDGQAVGLTGTIIEDLDLSIGDAGNAGGKRDALAKGDVIRAGMAGAIQSGKDNRWAAGRAY